MQSARHLSSTSDYEDNAQAAYRQRENEGRKTLAIRSGNQAGSYAGKEKR